ncbi:hypothetical protein AAG906_026334 [Vitis piasezkii]
MDRRQKTIRYHQNNRTENSSVLRDRLISMEDMSNFKKLFIFFSCATLLAPTSKLDDSHELWCTLLAEDFDIDVNWGQFVLDIVVVGIRHFLLDKGSCDDLMKKMMHVQEDEMGKDVHEDPTNSANKVEEKTKTKLPITLNNEMSN